MSAHESSQRGSALVLALFVITLLTGMGTALLFLSQHESRMSRAALREKKSFYLAEAGIEHARMTLFAANPVGQFDDDLVAAAGADGQIGFDAATLATVYASGGDVTSFDGYADDLPLAAFTELDGPDGAGWYAAFLTNDPGDGVTNKDDINGRVMITAIGAGEDRSIEVVQAIVEAEHFIAAAPAAAITMLGPLPAFYDNGSSNAQTHTGNDCGLPGGAFAPIIGTVSPASKTEVQGDIHKPENFTAGGPPPAFVGTQTVGDLTNLADPIVSAAGHGIIDPMWTDCASLKQLVIDLRSHANYYCNAAVSACTFPATGPSTIVFIDGDLAATPAGTYSGTLVVTGQLTYHGNTGWNGIILAVGEGRVIRTGGGGGKPNGGLILANIDPSPNGPPPDRSDWCTTGVDGFGPSFYDTSGGGNSTVQWCSSFIESANPLQTYRVSEFLQR